MQYSLSIYETLALTQIFDNKLESNSPLNDVFEEMQSKPSIDKNVEAAKSRILAEGSASKSLEHIFGIIENPERLYTVFVKNRSNVQVYNFFEKNQKIASFSSDDEMVYLDSTLTRDDFTNFVLTQIGETTENGSPLRISLDFFEFLALTSASALSRICSKDQIVNLLGEASFTKDQLLRRFSASEKAFEVTAETQTPSKYKQKTLKASDSLIQKGILKCSKSKSKELLTINDNFTEITNVLSSPDLVIVVCNYEFSGSLHCFSFVKSWDNELVSLVRTDNQPTLSSVTVERRFAPELKDYIQNSLYNLNNGTERVQKTTQQYILEGQQYIRAGKLNAAVKLFHEVLRLTPNDSDVWYWLGVAYHRMNLLFDAIRCYNKAVGFNSNSAKAWFDLGCAHYQMNEYPEAANSFIKITEINPQPHDAWFWAGLSCGNYGEFKLASKFLSEAAKRKPNDPRIWYSLAQASVEILNQSRNKLKAKKMAKKILQYLKNAEEKGIEKVLPEESYNHFKVQMQHLIGFLGV